LLFPDMAGDAHKDILMLATPKLMRS